MEGLRMQNFKRMWALLGVVVIGASVAAASAVASHKAGPTIVIWADADRAPAVQKVANGWAAANGATVNVVTKTTNIRDDLGTVAAADAPDIIIYAHDATGKLAANGLVEPLFLAPAVKKQFPSYTLDAFSYGTAVKKLYGLPYSVENIGLVVNTKLAKVPKTFSQLESEALAWKKAHRLRYGICVQQGAGDPYHMYPFFSGLGGYIFGKNSAGNLDPSNIGVANPRFLKNASLIDKWNKEGLIRAQNTGSSCTTDFTGKKTPFWVTGPWNADTITKAGITSFKVIQIPKIVDPAVPFLGVNGLYVTKYATVHNVDSAAKDLVTNYLATPSAQTQLAAANGRAPANINAKAVSPVMTQFGVAGKGGVPMPNIPQMDNVWTDLGQAWVRSTKGAGAMPAARSFKAAARSIADKIG